MWWQSRWRRRRREETKQTNTCITRVLPYLGFIRLGPKLDSLKFFYFVILTLFINLLQSTKILQYTVLKEKFHRIASFSLFLQK